MLTIEDEREKTLINSVRKMSPEQVDSLLSFLKSIIENDEYKKEAKLTFLETIDKIAIKAQERGLTEEMLNEISSEKDQQ